jgi:hypothetical protein
LYKQSHLVTAQAYSIAVGAGGIGGASATSDTSGGNAGQSGEDTNFGIHLIAKGGIGGLGGVGSSSGSSGTTQEPSSNTPNHPLWSFGCIAALAASNTTGGSRTISPYQTVQPNRFIQGGNGGGLNTGNVETAGGAGGRFIDNNNDLAIAPIAGAIATNGNNGDNNVLTKLGLEGETFTKGIGISGSGGGSHYLSGGNGGAGGDGGLYGGGGGGGGASTNTVNGGDSGKGGDGAQGCLIIVEYLRS